MNDTVIGSIAALGSVLFFGSYAVPIKMPSALLLDPFVFQFYKSTACFVTSWLVLLYVPYRFTWWGMLGALIWVANGIIAIAAVRWAGIGVAQSLWSGLSSDSQDWKSTAGYVFSLGSTPISWVSKKMHAQSLSTIEVEYRALVEAAKEVFIAYIWGGYVFKEPLKDHSLSLVALVLMTVGMIGVGAAVSGKKGFQSLLNITLKLKANSNKMEKACSQYSCVEVSDSSKPLIIGEIAENLRHEEECGHCKNERSNDFIKGVLCAILVGTLNGSFMIPLKYANKDIVGIEYLVSFGIGAMSMTVVLLAIYMAILAFYRRPMQALYLPGAAGTALLAGILWSLGNFFSIYATLYLGVALGWPLVQCQLLVSAMWAVFYYKEVGSGAAAALLFGSSVCVVSGAIMLSQFGSVG